MVGKLIRPLGELKNRSDVIDRIPDSDFDQTARSPFIYFLLICCATFLLGSKTCLGSLLK
jgi:hypothetical protein